MVGLAGWPVATIILGFLTGVSIPVEITPACDDSSGMTDLVICLKIWRTITSRCSFVEGDSAHCKVLNTELFEGVYSYSEFIYSMELFPFYHGLCIYVFLVLFVHRWRQIIPPETVCTHHGCAIDEPLAGSALSLEGEE